MNKKRDVFQWYGEFLIDGVLYTVMEMADYNIDESGKQFPHKWDSKNSKWVMLTEEEKKKAKRPKE